VFVLSGRGLCDGPIPRPEESYRLWCVSECDHVKIKKPSTPTVNKWVEEGRTTKRNETKMSYLLYKTNFSGHKLQSTHWEDNRT
jgi:hypothetical protein